MTDQLKEKGDGQNIIIHMPMEFLVLLEQCVPHQRKSFGLA